MAVTLFWMYPEDDSDGGPTGWVVNPTSTLVDEAYNAPDDSDRGESDPVPAPNTWRFGWSMTPPAAAVVIDKVSLYARVWAVSQNSTPHDLTDVKGFYTDPTGTRHYTSGQTVLGTTGAQGPNPQTYLLGDMATNPDTGLAWTLPELQAAIFGVEYVDEDVGSNTPQTFVSHFYAVVEAQTIAQSIEGRRAEGSHYLLTLGKLHDVFEVLVPPTYADLEPGDVVAVTDRLGPAASGAGWGERRWERREAMVLENEWVPLLRRCRLVLFDLRFFRTSLWWQPLTDLPYSEEGQGIPYLDSGGGYTVVRNATAYVRKQTLDSLYAEVPIDFPKWTSSGLQVGGGGDATLSLNDSFSQGAGSAFTNWTLVTTGTGAITQDTADYVFDAAGLRRSAVLGGGATPGATAYVEQAHAITGIAYGRVALLFKHDAGADAPHWRLQRAADGWWWNDTSGAWQAGSVDNAVLFGPVPTLGGYYSKMVSFAAGADTYTLTVGYVTATTVAGDQVHLYFAALLFGLRADVDGFRSLDITTGAGVVRERDDIQIANARAVRWWEPSPAPGQLEIRIRSLFEHAFMNDGDLKTILFCAGSASDCFEHICYLRVSSGEGRWRFQRQVSGVDYFADVVITTGFPILFEEWKLCARWTGAEGELDLPPDSLSMLANGTWSDPTTAVDQSMADDSVVYLGWNATYAVAGDFTLLSLRARRICLTDDETLRELG